MRRKVCGLLLMAEFALWFEISLCVMYSCLCTPRFLGTWARSMFKHDAGQLDDLVAGFSRTNSKLTDLRNSVRTACNRWGDEQLSQQQQLWKLQQATADLQRTAVSKPCSSSPHHSKSATLPVKSNETPTRNVFAEVQLNGQSMPSHEHDPKVCTTSPP